MKSSNPQIDAIIKEIDAFYAEGKLQEVVVAAEKLKHALYRQEMDALDTDDDEDDDSLDGDLADMVEEAILEDDNDLLIRAMATALMLSARAAGMVDLSAVAHTIWVE